MASKKRKVKRKIHITVYNTEEERARAQRAIDYVIFKEQEREQSYSTDNWLDTHKLTLEERIKLHKAQLLTNKFWFAVKDNYHSPWKEHIEENYTETDKKIHNIILNYRQLDGVQAKESAQKWRESVGKS